MTDLHETFRKTIAQYGGGGRDAGKQARMYANEARSFAAPAMRFAGRNPLLLIGAAVLAVGGEVAYANRRKIAARAAPMVEQAKTRGQALMAEAGAKGQELLETAKAKGGELAEKVRMRREAADGTEPTTYTDA